MTACEIGKGMAKQDRKICILICVLSNTIICLSLKEEVSIAGEKQDIYYLLAKYEVVSIFKCVTYFIDSSTK